MLLGEPGSRGKSGYNR